jgi:hypothetical protein
MNIITSELVSASDEKYKDFQSKLVPNIDKNTILGVRAPVCKSIAKKYANTGTRKAENAPKRKEDPEKTAIIDEISSFLIQKGYKNVEIVNKTRQITFKIEKNCYELTLIRKKKC